MTFRPDNTTGYTQAELDELNRRLGAALAAAEPIADDIREDVEKSFAEQVQAEFDRDRSG